MGQGKPRGNGGKDNPPPKRNRRATDPKSVRKKGPKGGEPIMRPGEGDLRGKSSDKW